VRALLAGAHVAQLGAGKDVALEAGPGGWQSGGSAAVRSSGSWPLGPTNRLMVVSGSAEVAKHPRRPSARVRVRSRKVASAKSH
jgi:hypothetical protein